MSKSINFDGFKISTDDVFTIAIKSVEKKLFVNTINSHSHVVAQKDKLFRKSLESCDYLIPDGIGIIWALKFLFNKNVIKISGYQLFLEVLSISNKDRKSVLFFGSNEYNLTRIEKRLRSEYPDIQVTTYSPPFKDTFEHNDIEEFSKLINGSHFDIIVFGLTAPKQEKLAHNIRPRVFDCTMITVGAVFDFYAGTAKRAPEKLIDWKLEWAWLLLTKPSRTWKRVFLSGPAFLLDVLKLRYAKSKKLVG